MGDVKLAFLMGAALGPAVAVALVLASLSSLVPSIVILVRHGRAGRKVGSRSAHSSPWAPCDALPLIALSVVWPTRLGVPRSGVAPTGDYGQWSTAQFSSPAPPR